MIAAPNGDASILQYLGELCMYKPCWIRLKVCVAQLHNYNSDLSVAFGKFSREILVSNPSALQLS